MNPKQLQQIVNEAEYKGPFPSFIALCEAIEKTDLANAQDLDAVDIGGMLREHKIKTKTPLDGSAGSVVAEKKSVKKVVDEQPKKKPVFEPEPPKRGRGRPPKAKEDAPAPEPKRRGRPPKVKEAPAPAPVEPKRRGRPPKVKVTPVTKPVDDRSTPDGVGVLADFIVNDKPEPVVAAPPKPEPVVAAPPKPEPVVAAPPKPEPVVAAPPKPEPVVAAPPKPEPVVLPMRKPVTPKGPTVPVTFYDGDKVLGTGTWPVSALTGGRVGPVEPVVAAPVKELDIRRVRINNEDFEINVLYGDMYFFRRNSSAGWTCCSTEFKVMVIEAREKSDGKGEARENPVANTQVATTEEATTASAQ